MTRPLVDEKRRENLEKATKELVDFGGDTCPICGSSDFMPSRNQEPAHCNSCQADMAEYLKSVGYKEVECCGNCGYWEDHLYATYSQGYKHCEIAQKRGVNWRSVEVFGWCEKHKPKQIELEKGGE